MKPEEPPSIPNLQVLTTERERLSAEKVVKFLTLKGNIPRRLMIDTYDPLRYAIRTACAEASLLINGKKENSEKK